jgi:hypothetical protein
MTTEFNFSRDFKNIIWKSTIFLNFFRAFIAGIIWTIIIWALAPSSFKVEMLFWPLGWPVLLIILFPITIIVYKIIPLIGLGMHIIGLILFGPADPILYLIHKKYPQFVPVKEYPIISFNLVIFVLTTDI